MFSLAQNRRNALLARELNFLDDPEWAFYMGVLVFGGLIIVCAIFTFLIIKPDLSKDPTIAVRGYYNVCIAFDYAPSNFIAAFLWQPVAGCWWRSAWVFEARCNAAKDTLAPGTLTWVRISACIFSALVPMIMCSFMLQPSTADELKLRLHTGFFEMMVIGTAQWTITNWIVAYQWHPPHTGFATFTLAVVVHVASACAKIYFHQTAITMYFKRAKEGGFVPHDNFANGWTHHLYSNASLTDFAWMGSLLLYIEFHMLAGFDPLRCRHMHQHGKAIDSTATGEFPPYCLVPEEDEQAIAQAASELAEQFEIDFEKKHVQRPGGNVEWGKTLGLVRAVFQIDERLELLHPDLRVGFLEKPAAYEAVIRIHCTDCTIARMSMRVQLPAEFPESRLLAHPLGAASKPRQEGGYAQLPGLQLPDDCPRRRVADFLFAEDLKEFFGVSASAVCAFLTAKNRPKDWGLAQYARHITSNLGTFLKMQAARTKYAGQIFKEGESPTNGVFGKEYYGGLPFRLGPGACKWGLVPRQEHPIPAGSPLNVFEGEKDFVKRETAADQESEKRYVGSANDFLAERDAVFDFCVQVATDPVHRLDQAASVWPEDLSPYAPVGTVTIPRGQVFGQKQADAMGQMVFSVWNQLSEHRPVGLTNNVRHELYKRHGAMRLRASGGRECMQCPLLQA